MNTPPRRISETGLYKPVWRELNRLIDYVREISPVGGRNILQRRTMNGTLTVAEDTKETTTEAGLIFRGEWSATEDYAENDIVIRGSFADESSLSSGKDAGTYIAKQSVPIGTPAPNEPASGEYWETFARYASKTFAVANGNNLIRLNTATNQFKIEMNAGGTQGLEIDFASGVWLAAQNKQLKVKLVEVCVNNQVQHMLVIGSDPWLPAN